MKKILFLLLIAMIFLNSCTISQKRMVEDLGSPGKIELLKERVNEFWTAFVKEDYEKIYYLFDPFFKVRTNKYAFIGNLGRIKYHEFEIKDIKVEGNVAKVKVKVVYSMPKTVFKVREFSVPMTPDEFEETWLYIYDNWYKEYYIRFIEEGIVKY